MDLKPSLKKLQESSDFKKWHTKNKETYLSYAFKIPQEMKDSEWQFGYYNKKKDRITTFVITNDGITIRPEEEIFKKEDIKISGIEIDKIKLSFDDAAQRAEELQRKNFPKDKSIKTIVILQNAQGFGNVWNITYVTEAFNTLNMKIDASTGKIVEHNLTSVLSFRKE